MRSSSWRLRTTCAVGASERSRKARGRGRAKPFNRRRHGNLREVLRALTLYSWLNTAEDEKRRIAARWAPTHGKSTRTNAPGAARRHPPEPGRQVFDADRGENLQPQLANTALAYKGSMA